MTFIREQLPDPVSYFEDQGLKFTGRGKWRTTSCAFHGGSDSMRINTETGGWCCMNCGEKGGDVLSYHMQLHGLDFVEACKQLGAWSNHGKTNTPQKPRPLPAADAIRVIDYEVGVLLFTLFDMLKGLDVNATDRDRAFVAIQRVRTITGSYQ